MSNMQNIHLHKYLQTTYHFLNLNSRNVEFLYEKSTRIEPCMSHVQAGNSLVVIARSALKSPSFNIMPGNIFPEGYYFERLSTKEA